MVRTVGTVEDQATGEKSEGYDFLDKERRREKEVSVPVFLICMPRH